MRFSSHLGPLLTLLVLSASFTHAAMVKDGDPLRYEPLSADKVKAVMEMTIEDIPLDDMTATAAKLTHGVTIVESPLVNPLAGTAATGASHASAPKAAASRASRATAGPLRFSDEWKPRPFTSLDSVVDFIRHQRSMGGTGLPATFYVPPGTEIPAEREMIIREGVGLYDTSLALLALIEKGELKEAAEILDIYARGKFDQMELRAVPNRDNQGAFFPHTLETPDSPEAYYFFDFTRANGQWRTNGDPTLEWKHWTAHTGPNAWLAIAIARFIEAKRAADPSANVDSYLKVAKALGRGMLKLQTENGGIRFAAKGNYFEKGQSDPYLEVNSENNVSAYAALKALARVTGQHEFQRGADDILRWFKNTPGLYDQETGLLRMGATVASENSKDWKIQNVFAADSGGTWTISSLGAQVIDGLWGDGSAYKMWRSTRERMGRSAQQNEDGSWFMRKVSADERLDGLDFSELFDESEALISPEWTGGGIFALKQLSDYYGGRSDIVSGEQLEGLRRDFDSMKAFLDPGVNAYAIGPGMDGSRQGRTGFGWYSPPASVSAMASIYSRFGTDPLAWMRVPSN
jgi:hypothetical protein